jgi:(2Fe-2S) ferredoxin
MSQVLVCQYANCLRNRSASVLTAFLAHPVAGVEVVSSACQGQCNMGPTVRVLDDDTWYCWVKPEDVPEIVEQHLAGGKRVDRLLHPRIHAQR